MKRMLVVLLAVVVMGNFALAGEDAMPKTKAGDKAYLFTLQGLDNLGAGNFAGGVGMKYYFNDGMALRLGLGLVSASETVKDDPPNPGPDEKTSELGFSIAPGIQYNLSSTGPVVSYVGAQVVFSTRSEEVENPNHVANTKESDTETGFGLGVLGGVEWFPWNNISLGAEYMLSFSSASGKIEITSGGTTVSRDKPSITAIGIGSSVSFTLAIYW